MPDEAARSRHWRLASVAIAVSATRRHDGLALFLEGTILAVIDARPRLTKSGEERIGRG